MNKVVLIGRLTKDPELKFTPGNGTAVCNFTLAVDRRSSKNGQKEADFIPIIVWGKQGEATANYKKKGSLIAVSGRIQTRSYEAKDGSRRYVTEVIADEVQFLDKESKGNNNSNNNSNYNNNFNENNFGEDITPVDDGDIPF